MPIIIPSDAQELQRETDYHMRLIIDSLFDQCEKIALLYVKRRLGTGVDAVSGLSPDELAGQYVSDSFRRFAQLFMGLPMNNDHALALVDEKRRYLSVPDVSGEVIQPQLIEMIVHLPNQFIYLPMGVDERGRIDVAILEGIDRYIFQQFEGVSLTWDMEGDDDETRGDSTLDEFFTPTGALLVSIPWNMTRESVILSLENIRDNKRKKDTL